MLPAGVVFRLLRASVVNTGLREGDRTLEERDHIQLLIEATLLPC